MKKYLPLLLVFGIQPAHAIKGDYLPESELPKNVCRIFVDKVITTFTPTYRNHVPIKGYPTYTHEEKDMKTLCTGTLVGPHTILTAGHCYSGTHEQLVVPAMIKYPYSSDGKKRLPHCEGEDFDKNPKCKPLVGDGIITTKWVHPQVSCPSVSGKIETRDLNERSGYPNPLFGQDNEPDSASKRNFDVTVWNFEGPMLDTPIAEMNFDTEALHAMWKPNRLTCKSFGYGTDNEKKTGTLHGAFTPLTATWDNYTKAYTKENGTAPLASMGRTAPGDSGGPLFCTDLDGRTKLFGITSRGISYADQAEAAGMDPTRVTQTDKGIYALPSWNKEWIQLVMEKAPLTRPGGEKWWWDFTLDYQVHEFEKTLATTEQCVTEQQNKMGADYEKFVGGIARLKKEAAEAKTASAKEDKESASAIYEMMLKHPYQEVRQMLFSCRKNYE